ncbi:helix-turn-helix domain-containing protein [Clostridium sp. D53t1_180928_C8]|uniref:helix-turn-helix domain-containing protein n=1 Tax=Clostridium sp. D53t1_180928_C8 TaxID=2787101 RepID=UPI0018AB0464|nr:helix-turn-helix domain-containing protein [Clostridium sp. D53t1_180928_C8]
MRIEKFKNKSYTRFLISYLAILLIPILTITLILSKTVFSILENEIQSRDKAALKYSSYLLENNISDCIKISENLVSKDNILPFKFTDDVTESMRTISVLNKYTAINNFFDKIFIHFFDDDYVFSDTSSYTLKNFYKQIDTTGSIHSELTEVLTSIKEPTFIKNNEKNLLYYAIPYIFNNDIVGSILFSINMKTINSIVNSSGSDRYSLIIDNNYNITNLSNSNISEYKDKITDYILSIENNFKKEETFTYTINNNNVFLTKLPNVNLYFSCVTPYNNLFAELSHVTKLLIITIILAFILGSIAITISLKFNYKPINHLKELSKKMNIENTNDSEYNEYNEFDLIENTLYSLREKNTELEYELSKNIPLMQSLKLNELINGTVSDSNRFLKESSELGLKFTSKYHAIILIRNRSSTNINITSLADTISKYNIQNFSIDYEFLVTNFVNELSVFLVGLSNPTINLNKRQSLDKDIIMSIGSVQEDINLLAKSYIDSRTNLEVFKNIDNNQLIKSFINKYDEILKDVNLLINNNKFDEASIKICLLLSELQKEKLPFKLVRSVYFELIIMYNNYIDKNKHAFNYPNIDLLTLYQIKSLDELTDVFKEISSELLVIIKNKKNFKAPKLAVEKIKEYILENYTDYSFSLQLVSDNFDVSLSYLSQYFKDKTGITILDYITNLKINKSKELLINSNLTLRDIADQMGYSNVSSFIRRFKQVTSMTPGEFKKNNLKEDKS